MAGNILLLDTNIVIAILNNPSHYEEKLVTNQIHLSSIVVGELYYGAYNSQKADQNIAKLQEFIRNYPMLLCDQGTAPIYGKIKFGLKLKGRPIPENDIWIAAQAMQHQYPLITNDAHFSEVEGLKTEKW